MEKYILRGFRSNSNNVITFANLHCVHNNQYSSAEKDKLIEMLRVLFNNDDLKLRIGEAVGIASYAVKRNVF